jgi:hypothetical protein
LDGQRHGDCDQLFVLFEIAPSAQAA